MNGSPTGSGNGANNQGFGIPVNNGNQVKGGGPVNIQRSMTNQQMLQHQQAQQLQLQHKQRMLLQQRTIQQQKQQQASQNYEAQFYQLLMTLNEKPKRIYNFVETPDFTLKKYEQYRPSFEFHIYENNYKICAPANTRLQQQQKTPELTSDGLILNKNNAILKDFLECVSRGKIPESIMEVLRDCNIQFYEGNLILQVYDHTNTVDVIPKDQKPHSQSQPLSQGSERVDTHTETQNKAQSESQPQLQQQHQTPQVPTDPSSSQASVKSSADRTDIGSDFQSSQNRENDRTKHEINSPSSKKSRTSTFKRPRVYRTLLRPNDLTQYYDMMSYADHTRFSDSIYQQLESEILSLTKRNLSLDVPLNPYDHRDKLEENLFATPQWDAECEKLIHRHREESRKTGSKGVVGHIEEHEELPQHYSNYEQMMMIMSERTTTSTNSTFAASLTKNTSPADMANASKSGSNKNMGSSSGGGTSSSRSSSNNNQVAIAAAAAAAATGLTVGNENNQFSRLKFIEQWRVNKEKRKQQALNNNMAPSSYNKIISMATPINSQHHFSQQQQQQVNDRTDLQEGNSSSSQNLQQQRTSGKRTSTDKTKAKRPRKTKKSAATENKEGPAKKKRAIKKKQNDSASPTVGNEN